MTAKTPREIALEAIIDVNEKGSYSNLVLNEKLRRRGLSEQDKGFITELVYGTLERQIQIDWVIGQFVARTNIHSTIRNILRMGIYQIFYMEKVPPSAACNESVNLVKKKGKSGLASFVNGVLRNIIRNTENIHYPKKEEDPGLYLAITYSFPLFIVNEWLSQYGFDFTEKMLSYRNEKKSLTARPNLLRISIEEWQKYLDGLPANYRRGDWVSTAYHVDGIKDVGSNAFFLNGLFSVQGESSMLVCKVVNPSQGQKILDACSAPGGKSAYMAEQMKDEGEIISWDIHEHRVKLVDQNAERLNLHSIKARVQAADDYIPELKEKMDVVLVDAPCSGLGVIGSKPDIKLRRTPEEIQELSNIQKKILETCSRYVKPGGSLVYSTCTIHKSENEEVIQWFLSRNENFKADDITPFLPEGIDPNRVHSGYIQLFPHLDHLDGFFIAKMKKRC